MLRSQNAIVTGSTSGIGRGIAEILASKGCNILLNGFGDAKEIEALRTGIAGQYGVKTVYHGADMNKPEQIAEMVQHATRELGAVDILVNNAGIQHVDYIEDFPVEKWDAVIAINLSSAFHAIRQAIPQMKQRKRGRIINIASAHGLVASAKKTAYVAAKHGIVGLTKAVALEVAEHGITCNAICPGWVLTPLVQKQIDALAAAKNLSPEAAKLQLLSEKQPSKEFVTVHQIGEMTAFLASEHGAGINGAMMSMDGGWTAQ